MASADDSDDIRAIEETIARQFASLSWTPNAPPDWDAFSADFFPGAPLYPAARPAQQQSVEAFVTRMKGLADAKLRSFHESLLGTEVRVFGNVALALAACEITENEAEVSRGVEMLLLIKDEGVWRIASQAWDTESETKPLPRHLMGGTGRE